MDSADNKLFERNIQIKNMGLGPERYLVHHERSNLSQEEIDNSVGGLNGKLFETRTIGNDGPRNIILTGDQVNKEALRMHNDGFNPFLYNP